jgi:hypothetical protein
MVDFDLSRPAENVLLFLVERAKSIDRYAEVEQSLCRLFSNLMGTTADLGGIVFFRIGNARSRNLIIEQLLEKRYARTYEAYWRCPENSGTQRPLQPDTRPGFPPK